MRRLLAYALYCLVVVGLFGYGHYGGRSILDDLPNQPSDSGSSGGSTGGFFYTGSSGGSHK